MTQTNTTQWTTRTLLEWMKSRFEDNAIESPRLIAEMLLTHVLGGQRIDLYANIDRNATEDEREALRAFVKRALEHEPVQYIVGKAWFNGLEFSVNPSTLIPRTCTETIVDQCLQYCSNNTFENTPRIADIGTGSGCIAISIAVNQSPCSMIATDISEDALLLAIENVKTHGVEDSITCIQGEGLSPLQNLDSFDIICSNPPYIPDDEMAQLASNVKDWEPTLALSGGQDGLQIIGPILETAHKHLHSGGMLLLEITTSIQSQVLTLANSNNEFRDATILRDHFGDDRFLRVLKG